MRRFIWSIGGAVDGLDNPVAAAGNRRDRPRPERPAQGADLHLKVVLLDHQAGPDEIEQFVLADDAVAECCRRAVERQQALPGTQFTAAEAEHG